MSDVRLSMASDPSQNRVDHFWMIHFAWNCVDDITFCRPVPVTAFTAASRWNNSDTVNPKIFLGTLVEADQVCERINSIEQQED